MLMLKGSPEPDPTHYLADLLPCCCCLIPILIGNGAKINMVHMIHTFSFIAEEVGMGYGM